MHVRELRTNQIAGFMVNPSLVRTDKNRTKTKTCSDGKRRRVYLSCNHISRKGVATPHPEAFQFVNMDEDPIRS